MIIVANDREVLDRVGRFTDTGEGEDPGIATSGHEFSVLTALTVDETNMTVDFEAANDDDHKVYAYTVRVDRIPVCFGEMFDGSVSWLAIDAEEVAD